MNNACDWQTSHTCMICTLQMCIDKNFSYYLWENVGEVSGAPFVSRPSLRMCVYTGQQSLLVVVLDQTFFRSKKDICVIKITCTGVAG